jgi:hypothetical protein
MLGRDIFNQFKAASTTKNGNFEEIGRYFAVEIDPTFDGFGRKMGAVSNWQRRSSEVMIQSDSGLVWYAGSFLLQMFLVVQMIHSDSRSAHSSTPRRYQMCWAPSTAGERGSQAVRWRELSN